MREHRVDARTRVAVFALATLLIQACTTPQALESRAALGSPTPTTAPNPSAPSPAIARWVSEQDGARLEMAPAPDSVEAGKVVTFRVSLTNERDTPLQFTWDGPDCFAYAYIDAFIPQEPIGRTDWTGEPAAFKDRILTGTGGPPDHTFVEPLSTGSRLLDTDCVERDGVGQPLAPGETTTATFTWTASFDEALPTAPPLATFRALAFISQHETLVTPAPPPTSFPSGRWFTGFRELWVSGTVGITGKTRAMASLGQIVDGALADPTFLRFVTRHPVEGCLVSLQLPSGQGRYLPAGPGWNLEELCEHPRRFIRAEIDPWTAVVKGLDVCDQCGR